MNRWLLIALAIAALNSNVNASIPSIKESEPFQPEASKTAWHEVVENDGASQVIFFHATFQCHGTNNRIEVIHDSLWRFGLDKDIPPGGSVEIAAADPSNCVGGVDAVAFSDGHFEGDQEVIRGVYKKHRGAYNALNESIQDLDALANGTETVNHICDLLKASSASASANLAIDVNERVGMDTVYNVIRQALQIEGTIRVPSDYTSNRQPTVDEIVKDKGLSREQARGKILANKCMEWRSALDGHTEPNFQ